MTILFRPSNGETRKCSSPDAVGAVCAQGVAVARRLPLRSQGPRRRRERPFSRCLQARSTRHTPGESGPTRPHGWPHRIDFDITSPLSPPLVPNPRSLTSARPSHYGSADPSFPLGARRFGPGAPPAHRFNSDVMNAGDHPPLILAEADGPGPAPSRELCTRASRPGRGLSPTVFCVHQDSLGVAKGTPLAAKEKPLVAVRGRRHASPLFFACPRRSRIPPGALPLDPYP